ncbi:predicted protein [Plenodomus lingam JN3]|uniref:Predicted protein n=2 Tax=Leptosphaeria maculans TaxID=5022 RepID=E5A9H0_LEPMJ|nr:predicted protein [Plenodomus lingam JN3]CBY00311.1 predicted protein [Plenodomus lingam JN3]
MFVANIPSVDCTTAEGQDFVYPNPGRSVANGEKATPGNKMSGSACATSSKPGAGEGTPTQPEAPAQSSAASEQPGAQPPAYSPTPIESAGPIYSAAPIESAAPVYSAAPINPAVPVKSPSPIGPEDSSKSDGVSGPGAPSSPAAPPSSPPTYGNVPTNSTPSSDGECTPCSNDGAVVCIGNSQFGICNRGCAVAQDLAAGMSCSDGVVVSSTKRSVRFPRAHLHRHLHRRHGMSSLL